MECVSWEKQMFYEIASGFVLDLVIKISIPSYPNEDSYKSP